MPETPEININIDNGDDDKKPSEPHWKWILKHVVVPLATALIGAASAGYVVQIQADTELKKEQMNSAVKTAASDAALAELRKRFTPLVDPRGPVVEPDIDPPASDEGGPLDLPDEPPELTDYIDPSQIQQIQGDPILLGEANAQFREEWQRVRGQLQEQVQMQEE
jgi:hypothetical protein